MTRMFLLRHAESEWNAEGRWQGQGDPPLSEVGRAQAKAAATRLDYEGPVVSSPLIRAFETAELLASSLGLDPVDVEPGLVEIDVGEWSGLTGPEIASRFPELWEARLQGRLERFPGGESVEEFRDRIRAALDRVAASYESDVLVVTHGGAIASMERLLGVHPGTGVPNLGGRWFEVASDIRADPDRVFLVEE